MGNLKHSYSFELLDNSYLKLGIFKIKNYFNHIPSSIDIAKYIERNKEKFLWAKNDNIVYTIDNTFIGLGIMKFCIYNKDNENRYYIRNIKQIYI